MKLYFAKLKPDAVIPSKEDENAGYDIYARFDEDHIVIKSGKTKLIGTGIACAVSSDYYVQVEERGSTGKIGMKVSAGIIDSGYRGEIFIAITNCNREDIVLYKQGEYLASDDEEDSIFYPINKAIAQLIVHRSHKMDVEEVDYETLKSIPSNRGTGKLGSSGK